MNFNKIVTAAKSAKEAMKPTPATYEEMVLAELKAMNSKMSWFVILSVVTVVLSLLSGLR